MLRIDKLYKKYKKNDYALCGLNMKVENGELYGFVGPNGAGKTTTIRIIAGLLRSDSGEIWLDGVKAGRDMCQQKSLIGFVPDFFGVYENLTVMEYLEFFAASYGIYGKAGTVRSYEVLDMVNLMKYETAYVDELSRGMQQRLCLARALLNRPRLLLLDEPSSGLDPRTRKEFQLLLQKLKGEGYTILISSHILSELSDMCTSIGIIHQGKMVLEGEIDQIMLSIDNSNPLRITVMGRVEETVRLIREDPQVERISVEENRIAAWFRGTREEEVMLLKKLVDRQIPVISFGREQTSLESLFLRMTRESSKGEQI